jgi:hypothetical protein
LGIVLLIQHYLRPKQISLPYINNLPNLFTTYALPFVISLIKKTNKIHFKFYVLSLIILLVHEYYRTFDQHRFDWLDILFSFIGLVLSYLTIYILTNNGLLKKYYK